MPQDRELGRFGILHGDGVCSSHSVQQPLLGALGVNAFVGAGLGVVLGPFLF